MDIGEEKKEYIFEPLEAPTEQPVTPEPVPAEPATTPEPIPAGSGLWPVPAFGSTVHATTPASALSHIEETAGV